MKARTGSVFAYWVHRWQRYALRQLCGEVDGRRWWLDLDWFEPELPIDFGALRPLRQFRFEHDGAESYWSSDGPIPPGWVSLGEREPLRSDTPTDRRSASAMWRPPAAASEHEWRQHPQAQRNAFKRAAASDATVKIAGAEVPVNTTTCPSAALANAPGSELAQLVCVRRVTINHDRPDLDEALSAFPFLQDVVIEIPLTEITLPATVTELEMVPGASADMVVHGGSVAKLVTEGDLLVDLPELTDLVVYQVDEFDVAALAQRYPRLVALDLSGAVDPLPRGSQWPTLTRIDALVHLTDLAELDLADVYGFDVLPYLPSLTRLHAEGIPERAGTKARHDYGGIDATITKLRSDAWLTDNLGNPFHGWEGDEFAAPGLAAAAWTAFQNHRDTLDAAAAAAAAGEITTDDFNQLVADTIATVLAEFDDSDNAGGIGALGRDEIADAYSLLLSEVANTYPVDVESAIEPLHRWTSDYVRRLIGSGDHEP